MVGISATLSWAVRGLVRRHSWLSALLLLPRLGGRRPNAAALGQTEHLRTRRLALRLGQGFETLSLRLRQHRDGDKRRQDGNEADQGTGIAHGIVGQHRRDHQRVQGAFSVLSVVRPCAGPGRSARLRREPRCHHRGPSGGVQMPSPPLDIEAGPGRRCRWRSPCGPIPPPSTLGGVDPSSTSALQRLADAFGSEATLDAVADAIITRSQKDLSRLTYGQNEWRSLLGMVSVLVDHEGALAALESHDPLPQGTVEAMSEQVRLNPPETIEPDAFLGIVLSQIRAVL